MARHVVVVEGEQRADQRYLEHGAVEMRDADPIPVQMLGDTIIGKASGFERDPGTGEISLNIELFPDYKASEDDWQWAGYLSNLVTVQDEDILIITSGFLRAITAVPRHKGKVILDGDQK